MSGGGGGTACYDRLRGRDKKIAVSPTDFRYYLDNEEAPQNKTWEGAPVAILAVMNHTAQELNMKVRVNNLKFLVRPPRFKLPANCQFQPLLIRLSPGFSDVKMHLCEDEPGQTGNDPTSTKLMLKKVLDASELKANMTVSRGRRGNVPIFHSIDLTVDQVRAALDGTGVRSIAADFIERGIPFKRLCAIVWGCCLQVRPQSPHGFQHKAGCPLVTLRDKVQLTKEGQNCRMCPLCEGPRAMIQQGEGGIPADLINIVMQFIDPLF